MKKIATFIALILLASGIINARAEIAQQAVSATVITTAGQTNVIPLRGIVRSIVFDVPSAKTGGISIVSSDVGTILSVSGVTADTVYQPVFTAHTSAGSVATNGTSQVLQSVAVVGDLTIAINPAANTTGTNTYVVKINYDK